jgi:hypothetical protein
MVHHTPSLHIIGLADPLLSKSEQLCALYAGDDVGYQRAAETKAEGTMTKVSDGDKTVDATGRASIDKCVLTHKEGHNIPSIRTGLYPLIKSWIYGHTYAKQT